MTPRCFHLSGTEKSKLALPSQMPLQWPVAWSLNSEPRVSCLGERGRPQRALAYKVQGSFLL